MGRKDHYLPRGYLRGFIHPKRKNLHKPLWHYDVVSKVWKQYSPAQVGFKYGFYDPAPPSTELPVADEAFSRLEREYPPLIKELARDNFSNWRYHFAFLLQFMHMMRARSPLFFAHNRADLQSRQAFRIEEIDPIDNRKVKVQPVSLPAHFIKNQSLTVMRDEILRGPERLKEFDWALRWTDDPDDPCITTEQPFVMEAPPRSDGTIMTMTEAFESGETLLHFPLCWQAVLYGSRRHFTDPPTDRFVPQTLHNLRKSYFDNAQNYVVSPLKLEEQAATPIFG
jgi:hypothetical protein